MPKKAYENHGSMSLEQNRVNWLCAWCVRALSCIDEIKGRCQLFGLALADCANCVKRIPRRGKGKRGGLRVIYYWWSGGDQFWLFTVYDKDQADDLTSTQRKVLKQLLKNELKNRHPQDGEHDDQ